MDSLNISVMEKTNKGKPLLKLDGYDYQIEKQAKESTYWVCSNKGLKSTACSSRMITTALSNGMCIITKSNSTHNHASYTVEEINKKLLGQKIVNVVNSSRYLKTSVIMNQLHSDEQLFGCLPANSILKS